MSPDWTLLSRLIDEHERFVVTSHVRPDGDSLGSEVGMAGLLRQKGRHVRVVNASRTPPRYDFLDPDGTLFEHFGTQVQAADLADREVLVILDLSSWNQLGSMAEFVRAFPGPRVVIDHHVSQDDLGAIAYLKDTQAEATATLIFHAARALRIEITAEMAVGILTGLAMDTGWFRHPNTGPETLRIAAELIEAGAGIDSIYRKIFERNTIGRLRLVGEALASLRTDLDGRVVYTTVTRDDIQRAGAIPPDTEDLVDYTVSVRGAEVGILFVELEGGGVKASLRTRRADFSCAEVASCFGGGGHRAAAGATLPEPIDHAVTEVLAAVKKALSDAPP